MNRINTVVLCAVLFAVVPGCTVRAGGGGRGGGQGAGQAARAEGELLGERWVDGRSDRDVIRAANQGRFRQIVIAVEGSALAMDNVVVTFGDGSTFSPPTRLVFDQNSRSRVIDLPGGARNIQHIDFRYGNLPGGGRARVAVYGR